MPKVSVIMPVYNVEKYLPECLESIISQSLKDIEIICINDGSEDNSLNILNDYSQKDERFIIISQENQGQGCARNKGVEIAKGEYIQFVDPDDKVEADMLATMYDFAVQNHSQVVKFNYKKYYEYSGLYEEVNFAKRIKAQYNYDLIKTPYYTWKSLKKDCLSNIDLHTWSHFYLTEFVKNNKIKFAPTKNGEDHLFADGALLLADKIDYLDKYLYIYRLRNGSAVYTKSDINFGVFDNIRLLKEFLINNNMLEELQDEWKKYALNVISWHYRLIPDKRIKEYEDLCSQYFDDEKEFKKFIKKLQTKRSLFEEMFSIKNEYDGAIKYKVITILGTKIYLKPKQKKN